MSGTIQTELRHQFTFDDGMVCNLRNFDKTDISRVVQVERMANPHPWSERNFIDSVESSHICVAAEVERQIVGHAVFSIASGDAELLILSMDPQWQGRGIAKNLIFHMLHELEDYVAEIFLEVRESNDRAIHLYEKLGFNAIGTRPGYYPKGKSREDALIYARSLRFA